MKIEIIEVQEINEDGVAAASASGTAGMGAVTGTSPSTNVGVTIGSAYAAGGGTIGSGDLGSNWGKVAMQPAAMTKPLKKGSKKFKSLYNIKQDYSKKPKSAGKLKKFSEFNK